MKALLLLFILFSHNVFAQSTTKDIEKKIDLVIGIDNLQKFDFAPSTKVQVGDASIVNYTLIPKRREIIFSAKKPGSTNVTLRDTVGDPKISFLITVTETDQSKIVAELKEFLGDIEGLDIGVKANKVYVGGNIVVPNDIGRVTIVLQSYPEVINLIELSPQTQRIIARRMQNEVQKYQMKDVTVRVVNGIYWLEGVVSSEGQKGLAFDIARAFIPPNIESLAIRTGSVQTAGKRNLIENFISVNAKEAPPKIPKLIKITAQFVELTKSYSKLFGFKWDPFLTNGGSINIGKNQGGVTTNSSGTLQAVIDNLFPKLLTARDAGYARVLQSGVVVTKEGITASIKKDSTQNFAVGSGEFARPQKSTTGFSLEIKEPKILPGEKIDMGIGIGVSTAVGSPPTEQGNNISTSIIVKSKSTAVIGGFVKKSDTTEYDKDPESGATANNPNSRQLFRFLRSKSTTNEKTQFAIFITPEIVESAAEGTEDIKRKFRQRRR